MYTIGKVSKMFNLPISTLRYYDKEGFFPNIKRKGNIRYFGETELEAIRVIECLKKSDLEIKDNKQFFIWFSEGASTLKNRQELFKNRKLVVENKIKQLEKALSMIKFKCWYYDTLVENQEKGIDDPVVDLGTMPDEIKKYYDHAHEE